MVRNPVGLIVQLSVRQFPVLENNGAGVRGALHLRFKELMDAWAAPGTGMDRPRQSPVLRSLRGAWSWHQRDRFGHTDCSINVKNRRA
jgi:hypothetical protein